MKKTVLESFFKSIRQADFKVVYWDGTESQYGTGEPKITVTFREEPDLNLEDPVMSFGEAYMDGVIDYEGDFAEIIRVAELNKDRLPNSGLGGKMISALQSLNKTVAKKKQQENIKHHYDLGNDFFSLWLDGTMNYSCAYFQNPEMSLFEAQMAKIDHTLKKLNLSAGQSLLDIGSGWGWLIIRAAEKYDVQALGITLSEEQYQGTREKIQSMGLQDRVDVQLKNYLDLDENVLQFDKIVSIGMFEHVGKSNLAQYMEKVNKLLVPGGLSLLHTITGMVEKGVNSWIEKYIFPGGYIPSLRETIGLLPEYDFHLLHAESLRLHYALTLDQWYKNFKGHLEEIEQMFDRRFVRMWGLYLQGCAASFRVSGLDVHQLLFSKGLNNQLPLTFAHLYR
ncbi:MAG: class I SAM-dependent methyltransferase [Peptococcaceae bacterium]|nr:class I SAM-dependent methyltransferase [Candidatus Syntrophopropionicum ammoniitolerans]